MKRGRLIAIGLIAYTAGIVAMAPAALMDSGLKQLTDGKLRLVDAHGTLWSGSGQMELRDAAGRVGVADSLAWHLRLASLPSGYLASVVQVGQAGKSFEVTLSLAGLAMANVDLRLPATALALGLPKLAPLGLTGDVVLHIDSLSIERKQVRGKLAVQLLEAGSSLTTVAPLGDYELDLAGDGTAVNAVLRTLNGPLQIDGKGTWASGALPDFLAVARIPSQYMEQLAPLLRLIAVEREAGSFELRFK